MERERYPHPLHPRNKKQSPRKVKESRLPAAASRRQCYCCWICFPGKQIRRISPLENTPYFSILQSHKPHDLLHLCPVVFRQILRYCCQQGFLFFFGKGSALRQCFPIFQKNIQSLQSCFILAFFLSLPNQPQPFLAQSLHLRLCPVHPIPPFV